MPKMDQQKSLVSSTTPAPASSTPPPQSKSSSSKESMVPELKGILDTLQMDYKYEKKTASKKNKKSSDESGKGEGSNNDDYDSESSSGSEDEESGSGSDSSSSSSDSSSSSSEDDDYTTTTATNESHKKEKPLSTVESDKKPSTQTITTEVTTETTPPPSSKKSEKKGNNHKQKDSDVKKSKSKKVSTPESDTAASSAQDTTDFIEYTNVTSIPVKGMESEGKVITKIHSPEYGDLWVIKDILKIADITGTRLNSLKWKDQSHVKHILYNNRKANVAPAESVISVLNASKKARRVTDLINTIKSHISGGGGNTATTTTSDQKKQGTIDKSHSIPVIHKSSIQQQLDLATKSNGEVIKEPPKKRKIEAPQSEEVSRGGKSTRETESQPQQQKKKPKQEYSSLTVPILDQRERQFGILCDTAKILWRDASDKEKSEAIAYLNNFICNQLKTIS